MSEETPKEIAERILEIHERSKHGAGGGWIGDAICDAFKGTELLAKAYLTLERQCEQLEELARVVKHCGATMQTIGDGFDARNVYVVERKFMDAIGGAIKELDRRMTPKAMEKDATVKLIESIQMIAKLRAEIERYRDVLVQVKHFAETIYHDPHPSIESAVDNAKYILEALEREGGE